MAGTREAKIGKGDPRGAARRRQREARRKAKAALKAAGAAVEAPSTPMPPREPEEPANRVALNARARQMGWADADRARVQSLEGEAGRALHVAAGAGVIAADALPALWETWSAFQEARLTFVRLRLGASLFGALPSAQVLAERMEADPDATVDLREPEEREFDAREAWAYWTGLLRRMTGAEQAALRDQVADTLELVRDGALRRCGQSFVAALVRLDGMARR